MDSNNVSVRASHFSFNHSADAFLPICAPSDVCELAGLYEIIEQPKQHLAHLGQVHTLTQMLCMSKAARGANLDVSVPVSSEPNADTNNDKICAVNAYADVSCAKADVSVSWSFESKADSMQLKAVVADVLLELLSGVMPSFAVEIFAECQRHMGFQV